jgi:DsbC/DsbD-like thiol-disulfide interchange protein
MMVPRTPHFAAKLIPLSSILLFAFISATWGQDAPSTKVNLVADNAAVVPGSTATMGIHFQLEPGWHIYWINPGDAGEPPRVQWTLPAGWSAGALEWPVPQRLKNPAGVDYGYENDITLLSRLRIPASARSGAHAEVNANVSWLVCKETCIPQKGTARLSFSVAPKAAPADPASRELITKAKTQLPKPMPPTWKANVLTNPASILLNLHTGEKLNQATFFPADRQVIDNAAPQKLASSAAATQLSLKKVVGSQNVKSLKGVLVVNESDAYNIDVPIKGR